MNYILTILIFLVILFFYIHITDQYKKGEDLEIYETDYLDNATFQEACNVRQPFLVDFRQRRTAVFEEIDIDRLRKKTSNEVAVYDTNDYWATDGSVDSVGFPIETAKRLFDSDKTGHYFSENNGDYLEDCGLDDVMRELGDCFAPPLNIHSHVDFTFGSEGAYTPLRYHVDSRYILIVTRGLLRVKMAPWKNSKYLYPNKDYAKGEYKSPVNPWSVQEKYRIEMEKLKFLDFQVGAGYILSIPAYWWFSIKYEDEGMALTCRYSTVFNAIANVHNIIPHLLQRGGSRMSTNMLKKMPIDPIDNDDKNNVIDMSTKNDTDNANK